ncbi:MAG: sortase domain-bontaining protein [Microvirga sp.]|jgi:hypothetical protein
MRGHAAAGQPGTAVLSAHRDTHFAFLREVQVGDLLHVTRRDGTALRFRATGTLVVRWDASGIDPLAGPPKLVLSTCWPFNAETPGLEAELLQEPVAGKAVAGAQALGRPRKEHARPGVPGPFVGLGQCVPSRSWPSPPSSRELPPLHSITSVAETVGSACARVTSGARTLLALGGNRPS